MGKSRKWNRRRIHKRIRAGNDRLLKAALAYRKALKRWPIGSDHRDLASLNAIYGAYVKAYGKAGEAWNAYLEYDAWTEKLRMGGTCTIAGCQIAPGE